jgi:hypothetical protein
VTVSWRGYFQGLRCFSGHPDESIRMYPGGEKVSFLPEEAFILIVAADPEPGHGIVVQEGRLRDIL